MRCTITLSLTRRKTFKEQDDPSFWTHIFPFVNWRATDYVVRFLRRRWKSLRENFNPKNSWLVNWLRSKSWWNQLWFVFFLWQKKIKVILTSRIIWFCLNVQNICCGFNRWARCRCRRLRTITARKAQKASSRRDPLKNLIAKKISWNKIKKTTYSIDCCRKYLSVKSLGKCGQWPL